MFAIRAITGVSILIPLFALCSTVGHGQTVTKEKVLAVWQSLERQYEKISGEFDQAATLTENNSESIVESGIFELKRLGQDNQQLYWREKSQLFCCNSYYCFELSGPRNETQWVLKGYADRHNPEDNGLALKLQQNIESARSLVLPRIGLNNVFDFLLSDSIEMEQQADREKSRFIKMSIRNTNQRVSPPFNGQTVVQEGDVELDSDNHYLPVRYEMKFKLISEARELDGVSVGTTEYSEDVFPKKVEYEERYSASPPLVIQRKIACKIERSNLNRSDFLLSAFGLPEPENYRKTGSYKWLLPVIAIFGCVAFVIHFFKNR